MVLYFGVVMRGITKYIFIARLNLA